MQPRCHPHQRQTLLDYMQVMQHDHTYTGTAMLFPAITRTGDMTAVSPGTWPYECDIQDHVLAGMRGRLVGA